MGPEIGRVRLNLSGRPTSPQHPEGCEALPALLVLTADEPDWTHLLDDAREKIALLVGASPEEIVLTSGGAEASSAAVKGIALAALARSGPGRILLAAVEHAPIHNAVRSLEAHGFETVTIQADGAGRVDAARFVRALQDGAAFAALQWANDEFGTLQPTGQVARAAHEAGVPLVVDATAAAGWVGIDLSAVPISALSLSSRRMGGPPGVGALVLHAETGWRPLIEGGTESEGRRGGMLHPALVAAFGITAAAARHELARRAARATELRDALQSGLEAQLPGIRTRGPGG